MHQFCKLFHTSHTKEPLTDSDAPASHLAQQGKTIAIWLYFKLKGFPFVSCSLQKSADSTARTTMPALSAPTNINSLPPSPVDSSSSSRRLSWGRLVQRLADFSTSSNSSSIDSSSNSGSRSDLSDSGKQTCKDLKLCVRTHACKL